MSYGREINELLYPVLETPSLGLLEAESIPLLEAEGIPTLVGKYRYYNTLIWARFHAALATWNYKKLLMKSGDLSKLPDQIYTHLLEALDWSQSTGDVLVAARCHENLGHFLRTYPEVINAKNLQGKWRFGIFSAIAQQREPWLIFPDGDGEPVCLLFERALELYSTGIGSWLGNVGGRSRIDLLLDVYVDYLHEIGFGKDDLKEYAFDQERPYFSFPALQIEVLTRYQQRYNN